MPPSSTPAGPPCLALRTTCGRGVAVDRWPLPLPVPHSAPVVGSPPRGTSVLPPLWKTTRAPTTLFHFGALSRGLRARCLRFAVRLATAHARLACRWWPAFRCAGLVTRRAPSKFQPFTSWHPLLQAWPGAISMETLHRRGAGPLRATAPSSARICAVASSMRSLTNAASSRSTRLPSR